MFGLFPSGGTAFLFAQKSGEKRRAKEGCFISLAVPEKIIGLALILDFFDRCDSLVSLHPPPAALGSLPPSLETPGRQARKTAEVLRHFCDAMRAPASLALLRKKFEIFCRTAAAT